MAIPGGTTFNKSESESESGIFRFFVLRWLEVYYMNKFYVYAIVSEKDGVIYAGMASDCEKRLKEHNAGKSRYTSGHVPWRMFYREYIGESLEARKREKYFKTAAGKRKLKAILDKSK